MLLVVKGNGEWEGREGGGGPGGLQGEGTWQGLL